MFNWRLEMSIALTDTNKFDIITAFDTIHDQAHPTNCIIKNL